MSNDIGEVRSESTKGSRKAPIAFVSSHICKEYLFIIIYYQEELDQGISD